MTLVHGTQLSDTKSVGVRTVMTSRDFVAGFKEVREGKPFTYDRESKTDVWFYERGRQLALIYKGPLKEGQRLVDEAIYAYVNARRTGVIL